ncbi:MAG: response regulator, partial [Firmicutes bacterium]|nr:response regulator [Bacillota bacterium]
MFKSHEKFYSVNGKRLILIVDDEPVNQEMLAFVLRSEYEVLTADNGIQAIEMMRENSKKLSLVLLDLLMPEMSGIEVLRIVREDPELCDIPIVVMTADQ